MGVGNTCDDGGRGWEDAPQPRDTGATTARQAGRTLPWSLCRQHGPAHAQLRAVSTRVSRVEPVRLWSFHTTAKEVLRLPPLDFMLTESCSHSPDLLLQVQPFSNLPFDSTLPKLGDDDPACLGLSWF